jgi:restriction system protein
MGDYEKLTIDMVDKEATLWGIHAGKKGEADALFLKKDCIAIDWPKMGDLSSLQPFRDAFKSKLREVYPDIKSDAVSTIAGKLFRFVHEMKEGDIVAYPSKRDRHIHIGRVDGSYRYDLTDESIQKVGYPNRRAVTWLRSVPRTHFSQGALHEIGGADMGQIRDYAEEFHVVLEGKEVSRPVTTDDTVALIVEDTEDTTRDFIIKRLAQELKGHPFEHFVAHLLEAMGYRTQVSPEGADGGIDILAHKDELGFEPPIIKVQVKSGEDSFGDPVVSALYGKVGQGEFGLFVTLGTFTKPARNFANTKSNLRLIDGNDLVDLVLQHYDQFDSRYKGLLPLKRVYIPGVL